MRPSGVGSEFSPRGNVEYIGEYRDGVKNGIGTFYYENGDIAYQGEFKDGEMQGKGRIFNPYTQKIIYDGIVGPNATLVTGKVYNSEGKLLGRYILGKFQDLRVH